jgi:hypothetical protein
MSFIELFGAFIVPVLFGAVTDEWLIAASMPVFWSIWRFLRFEGGPPVLAFALTFHWGQIVIGLYYHWLTGRDLLGMTALMYQEMVVISLVCVVMLVVGLWLGNRLMSRRMSCGPKREIALGWQMLLALYVIMLLTRGGMRALVVEAPEIGQALVAITYLRFALFYLIVRRFLFDKSYVAAGLVVLVEVGLGLSGFFAEFREPLFIAAVVLAETFDYRSVRHWIAYGTVGVVAIGLGVMWMGIRQEIRQRTPDETVLERLTATTTAASDWIDSDWEDKLQSVDQFVDRMWDIYYPAVALSRVPSILPHTNGTIMLGALQHILMPRVLFPEKADLENDSNEVRKYTGMMVAGPESNTTIAFGYAIQAYIDYGLPWMFLPVLLFGVSMGAAYRFFLETIRHRELAIATVTVIFWVSLYAYNRAWAKMLGFAGTLMIYLGGVSLLLDRFVLMKDVDEPMRGAGPGVKVDTARSGFWPP